MLIMNRPDCEKCGAKESAITLVAKKWICGTCFAEFMNKKEKQDEALLMEE